MANTYWSSLDLPTHLLTDEIKDELCLNFEVGEFDHIEHEHSENGTTRIIDYDNKGEEWDIEETLEKEGVPFDRYIAGSHGYNPTVYCFRPPNIRHEINMTQDDEEFVPMGEFRAFMEKLFTMTREESIKAATELAGKYGSGQIPSLLNYAKPKEI